MEELKRQMIEAVAALNAHDKDTMTRTLTSGEWAWANEQRSRLTLAVAGIGRSMVNYWAAEGEHDASVTCGAEFAGHVCDRFKGHSEADHEDSITLQRWPVVAP